MVGIFISALIDRQALSALGSARLPPIAWHMTHCNGGRCTMGMSLKWIESTARKLQYSVLYSLNYCLWKRLYACLHFRFWRSLELE